MFAIRLEKDLEQEIDLLAKTKGSNRSAVVREAIVRYLEDNEDLENNKSIECRLADSSTSPKDNNNNSSNKKPSNFKGEETLAEWRDCGVTALGTTGLFAKFRISSLLFWR